MDTVRLAPHERPHVPALAPTQSTLPLGATQASFGVRVHAALVPFIASFVGPVALEWVSSEIRERGEPHDLVSALALGHALVMRLPHQYRARARVGIDELLRSIKRSSVVPPPVVKRG